MKTTEEKIRVMQAFVDGKQIEGRINDPSQAWRPVSDTLSWNWGVMEYRIKPTLREFWVNINNDSDCHCAHDSREDADTEAQASRVACIHVREIVE